MAAVRCECSPEHEPLMMLESKVRSTKGFNLDQKRSCSISLIFSCLPHGVHVNAMNRSELWNYSLCGEGREQLFYDIVLVQFRPDVLESHITKSCQCDLKERGIGTSVFNIE